MRNNERADEATGPGQGVHYLRIKEDADRRQQTPHFFTSRSDRHLRQRGRRDAGRGIDRRRSEQASSRAGYPAPVLQRWTSADPERCRADPRGDREASGGRRHLDPAPG
ncbi:hypothetical protein HBB16_17815 [Pseudonocardia sp. MCCB 268]|nr:hypothetical protein [Pseudonocardia cytotoxica]